MRVLLITDWNSDAGGAETYIMMLRDFLRATGDEVRLLACGATFDDELLPEERVYGSDRKSAQAFLQIVNPFAVARVRAVIREFRPEVAFVSHFAYHFSPAVFAPLRGIPVVVSVMDYKSICPIGSKLLPDDTLCSVRAGLVCRRNGCVTFPHWLRDRPRYALISAAMTHADRIVCPSRWIQAVLAASGIRADHVPLAVLPPGATFHRAPSASPVFLYCGRLSREKGVSLLLRAFARVHAAVPDARLRIVGDGPQLASLRTLAESLALADAVAFTGKVAHRSVESQLTDVWSLVAPSLWGEPFGLAAVEAIVRGVPVIASAIGGLAENVEQDAGGLLFANGNEDELTACIRLVADRKVFPSQQLAPEVVARATEATRVVRHVERIRSIFADVTGRATVKAGTG